MIFKYKNREEKQKFVSDFFGQYLDKSILDVGADEGHLKKFLSDSSQYTGIGLGGSNPDIIEVDLEKSKIPFSDNTFDTVICLDVLEHLENIHDVFIELCRVSKDYVIISLPNPWHSLWNGLNRSYSSDQVIKFYGLPVERPCDRHKWFFSNDEAKLFISRNSAKCGFRVLSVFTENSENDLTKVQILKRNLKISLVSLLYKNFSDKDKIKNLFSGTTWWVLQIKNNQKCFKQ